MKLVNPLSFLLKGFCVAAFFSAIGISSLSAATDTVKIVGFTFSPNTLNLHPGDTIIWTGPSKGPFGIHFIQNDTSSAGIPAGAAPFGPTVPTDSSLVYVVTIPGHYKYQCNPHASFGMKGSFDVATAAVGTAPNASLALEQNFPNPSNGITKIDYTLEHPAEVRLMITDIEGKQVEQLVNKFEGAGKHEVQFDAAPYADGKYIYQLQAGDAILTRQMIILKK